MLADLNFNSSFSARIVAADSGISEYSTTNHCLFLSARTPTLSFGWDLRTTLTPHGVFLPIQYPKKIRSATLTRQLSTQHAWIYSAPRCLRSSNTDRPAKQLVNDLNAAYKCWYMKM
ncbi:hypothetical protein PGT21_015037 [Puccinia graminis f. sp. tritici]|uniref:Uncharacterized protein n=1 Tax=Puccinia graminis f. sp. tritici TaxID=56615 RepID=A0A5B0MWS2_PUCGR|nr:hypothetical protein PGT21_015037 [Puccinia graminis f. sp. tritici]